jgi:hypothetical protein
VLGICVVYLVPDRATLPLVRLSLDQIARCTRGPYRIYGCALRSPREVRRRLERAGVRLIESTEEFERPSQEHAALLDRMADAACADGCDAVASFDLDSWPVMEGWDLFYRERLSAESPLIAMVRSEIEDNFPFPAFALFSSSFWSPGASSTSVELRAEFEPRLARLSPRPRETGSGLLAQLARDGLSFRRLERTNAWDVHTLMAGLYDDAVFHVGASSREPRFLSDERDYRIDGSKLRRAFARRMNAGIRDWLIEALQADHDELMRQLAGGPLRRFEPVLTHAPTVPPTLPRTPVEQRRRIE